MAVVFNRYGQKVLEGVSRLEAKQYCLKNFAEYSAGQGKGQDWHYAEYNKLSYEGNIYIGDGFWS